MVFSPLLLQCLAAVVVRAGVADRRWSAASCLKRRAVGSMLPSRILRVTVTTLTATTIRHRLSVVKHKAFPHCLIHRFPRAILKRRVPRFRTRKATMLLASCFAHAFFVFGLTLSTANTASAASPYQHPESLPQLNASGNGWPPEPFRTPLTNYKDGYLVFRDYGSLGSAKERNVLLVLLEMVTEANLLTPTGYPSRHSSLLNILALALPSLYEVP